VKFRGLVLAVVVLAGLGGFLYWSQHHKPGAKPDSPALPAILTIDAKAVTSLTLHDKGAPAIVLVPSNEAVWQITEPITFRADSASADQMVAALADLVPQRVVEDKPDNLARYGLADPSLTVDVAEKNNQSAHLILGDHTPTSDGVYVMVSGNPHVYTVGVWAFNTLGKKVEDLRNPHLVPVRSLDIEQLDIMRKGQDIAMARIPSGWQILKPGIFRANNYEVNDLVQQITSATWDNATIDAQSGAAFAHGTPVATAKVTTGTGVSAHTDTIEVRKSGDNDYAKSSAMAGTWKVDSSLAGALDRDVDTYRNKQILDFGYTNPLNIEYSDGTAKLNLVRSNSDWYSSGKKMDAGTVAALIAAVRGLSTSKFVDSGYAKPDVDLTVVSLDGRAIEKIHFQKTSDGAIAKREDGPGLYFLDATTMNNLYAAATGIKPAAPPAKKK
jgi:hypothetical protein